jgi:hypothetical protein
MGDHHVGADQPDESRTDDAVVSVGLTPDQASRWPRCCPCTPIRLRPWRSARQACWRARGGTGRCGPLADVPGQPLAPEFGVQGGEPGSGE